MTLWKALGFLSPCLDISAVTKSVHSPVTIRLIVWCKNKGTNEDVDVQDRYIIGRFGKIYVVEELTITRAYF